MVGMSKGSINSLTLILVTKYLEISYFDVGNEADKIFDMKVSYLNKKTFIT